MIQGAAAPADPQECRPTRTPSHPAGLGGGRDQEKFPVTFWLQCFDKVVVGGGRGGLRVVNGTVGSRMTGTPFDPQSCYCVLLVFVPARVIVLRP